jgi:acetyl esterase/lipase
MKPFQARFTYLDPTMITFRYTYKLGVLFVVVAMICSSCAFRSVTRSKGITYLDHGKYKGVEPQALNIFAPRHSQQPKEVLLFIHGGSWNSGKRSLYNFLGNRMARKGIVTVIIDYPLSPAVTYHEMVKASAEAVLWTKNNIKQYGGDPDKIFLSGHSAGGHIAALLTVANTYLDSLGIHNTVKGTILIDAAGLDMYTYLKERNLPAQHSYIRTFTNNPEIWKEASPIYHLHKDMPPISMLIGERTYPSIYKANERFYTALKRVVPQTQLTIQKRKKHIPMITQFLWTWNPAYKQILGFMKKPPTTQKTTP